MTNDTISRRAAIDALNEYFARIGRLKRKGLTKGEKAISLDTVGTIKTLPSAEPENIRCKDCRWWDKYGDDSGYCMAAKHGYFSEHWEISIRRTYKGDFYCADAEKKGDDSE